MRLKGCYITLTILMIFWSNHLSAQQTVTELLEQALVARENGQAVPELRYCLQALQIAKLDSSTSGIALILGIERTIGDIYQREGLHERALRYYEQQHDLQNDAQLLAKIATSSMALHRYDASAKAYRRALDLHLAERDTTNLYRTLNRLVEVSLKTGSYDTALLYENEILTLATAERDSVKIAIALNNIGYDLKFLKKYPESLQAFEQAFEIQRTNQSKRTDNAQLLMNMAIIKQNQGKPDESLDHLRRASRILETADDPALLTSCYELLSSVYANTGDYYNARIYCDQAEEKAKQHQYLDNLVDTYELSSLIYQKQQDYQMALEVYKQFLNLRDSLELQKELRRKLLEQERLQLANSEKQVKLQFAELEMQKLETKRQRSENEKQKSLLALQQAELARQTSEEAQAKAQFELARRQLEAVRNEQAIAKLRQEQKIKDAELSAQKAREAESNKALQLEQEQKKILEQDLKLKEAEQEKKALETRNVQRFYLGLLAFIFLILGFIIFFWINTNRKNKVLTNQKQEIAEANQEMATLNEEMLTQKEALIITNDNLNKAYTQITASIQYAQRIQSAILIPPPVALAYFDQGFVFFKPRDIVSGDFYWYSQLNHPKVVLTAVDCTGHGVPGAFMSLIGNDLLDGIVNLNQTSRPGDILDQLTVSVRRTLQQETTDNRDGMDMALITYDSEKHELEFAGAKNPILYFQNGEKHIIKGDRMPIGGKPYSQDGHYVTHQIPLIEKGKNTFYIFSDGFQDQFGGPKGRKYMSKRFHQFLASIHHLPMNEQHQRLISEFDSWMAEHSEDQVDDVLVIGFRV